MLEQLDGTRRVISSRTAQGIVPPLCGLNTFRGAFLTDVRL